MSTYRDNLARNLPKKQETTQYAPARQQQPTRSAESKAEAREKLKLLGTVVFCMIVALLLVGRYAHMVSMNYQLQNLQSDLQDAQDMHLKLEKQELQLESPDRIKSYAENKLGMHEVGENQVVVVAGGKQ